jgi:hypothetical protein
MHVATATATATATIYGWLAAWNTAGVPDGTYTLESVASYGGGVTGVSAPRPSEWRTRQTSPTPPRRLHPAGSTRASRRRCACAAPAGFRGRRAPRPLPSPLIHCRRQGVGDWAQRPNVSALLRPPPLHARPLWAGIEVESPGEYQGDRTRNGPPKRGRFTVDLPHLNQSCYQR